MAYFGHQLKGKNASLSIYDEEILALVLLVQQWHASLLRLSFIVYTNHYSLRYLWGQKIITPSQ